MDNLFEGLKANDLQDLVIPLISIDEYESKLDDDSVVVAFFVQDKDPSQDLNRFIQKGAVEILDTDVSPAPNEDGNYIVFVEFERDAEFPAKLIETLETLEGLTGLEAWNAQIYDVEGQLPVDLETLQANVRLTPHVEDDVAEGEEIKEFFRSSDLDDMIVEGCDVIFEARGVTWTLRYVDHGSIDDVLEHNAALNQASRLDEAAQSNVSRMQRMLGDRWIAQQRGEMLVVSDITTSDCMVFKL